MHDRVPAEEEQRETPAARPPVAQQQQPPAAMALQMQRTAGNRATAQMVQRWNPVTGVVGDVLGIGFDYAWRKFVQANREGGSYFNGCRSGASSRSSTPAVGGATRSSSRSASSAAELLARQLDRRQAGDGTHAITLDTAIFFNADMSDEPNVDTYVHELVHVAQYTIEGVRVSSAITRSSSSRASSAAGSTT